GGLGGRGGVVRVEGAADERSGAGHYLGRAAGGTAWQAGLQGADGPAALRARFEVPQQGLAAGQGASAQKVPIDRNAGAADDPVHDSTPAVIRAAEPSTHESIPPDGRCD